MSTRIEPEKITSIFNEDTSPLIAYEGHSQVGSSQTSPPLPSLFDVAPWSPSDPASPASSVASCVTQAPPCNDCAIVRFIAWVAVCRNTCDQLSDSNRLRCPLYGCKTLFADHEAMLQHIVKCSRLATCRYWCPWHGCAERFDDSRCTQCRTCPSRSRRRKMLSFAKSFFAALGHRKGKAAVTSPSFASGPTCGTSSCLSPVNIPPVVVSTVHALPSPSGRASMRYSDTDQSARFGRSFSRRISSLTASLGSNRSSDFSHSGRRRPVADARNVDHATFLGQPSAASPQQPPPPYYPPAELSTESIHELESIEARGRSDAPRPAYNYVGLGSVTDGPMQEFGLVNIVGDANNTDHHWAVLSRPAPPTASTMPAAAFPPGQTMDQFAQLGTCVVSGSATASQSNLSQPVSHPDRNWGFAAPTDQNDAAGGSVHASSYPFDVLGSPSGHAAPQPDTPFQKIPDIPTELHPSSTRPLRGEALSHQDSVRSTTSKMSKMSNTSNTTNDSIMSNESSTSTATSILSDTCMPCITGTGPAATPTNTTYPPSASHEWFDTKDSSVDVSPVTRSCVKLLSGSAVDGVCRPGGNICPDISPSTIAEAADDDRCEPFLDMAASVFQIMQAHIALSKEKICDIDSSKNDLKRIFCSMPPKYIMNTGLHALQVAFAGGNDDMEPFDALCLHHLIQVFSLKMLGASASLRSNSLFHQSLYCARKYSPKDQLDYLEIIHRIWQPEDASPAPTVSPMSRSQIATNTAEAFLDDFERSVLSLPMHATPDSIALSELLELHASDSGICASYFATYCAPMIIGFLSVEFPHITEPETFLESLGQDVGKGNCLRQLEIKILQAGKRFFDLPMIYIDEFAPRTRSICDQMYDLCKGAYPGRLEHYLACISLLKSLFDAFDTVRLGQEDLSFPVMPINTASSPAAKSLHGDARYASMASPPLLVTTTAVATAVSADGTPSPMTEHGSLMPTQAVAREETPSLMTERGSLWPTQAATAAAVSVDNRPDNPFPSRKISTVEEPKSELSCRICNRRFKGDPRWITGSLKRHMKTQHTILSEAVYRCPVPGCISMFTKRYDNLLQHIREEHPDYDGGDDKEMAKRLRKRRLRQQEAGADDDNGGNGEGPSSARPTKKIRRGGCKGNVAGA